MKWILPFLFLFVWGFTTHRQNNTFQEKLAVLFKKDAIEFEKSCLNLQQIVMACDSNKTEHKNKILLALTDCRLKYKRLEYFLEYFIPVSARPFNLAPVYEIEYPYKEYQSPRGLQYMESLLFEEDWYQHIGLLRDQSKLIYTYSGSLASLLYGIHPEDEQLLESIQYEWVRIVTLGLSGFDAPELKSGITESLESLRAMHPVMKSILERASGKRADTINFLWYQAEDLLAENPDFNSFDRLQFIRYALVPFQHQIKELCHDLEINLKGNTGYNLQSEHLFKKDALDLNQFPSPVSENNDRIVLGEKLFYEPALSGNKQRTCATCHQSEHAFSEDLPKSRAIGDSAFVKRNAPTLYYAAYQRAQFYDGRVESLEEQVKAVLLNQEEMNANFEQLIKRLKRNKKYRHLFDLAFPEKKKEERLSIESIAQAIASFEKTLAPFSSDFDHYLSGNYQAMSAKQINGFNLFMGKAKCGTCHFAPVFNGMHPPEYQINEFEIIGTPENANFAHPIPDRDKGRNEVLSMEYNIGAFKTPTLRNVALSAPYMHNGVYQTLEEVIEFYNIGGGSGLGLDIPYQTLSSKPLNLSEVEKENLVLFLHSLSDGLPRVAYPE